MRMYRLFVVLLCLGLLGALPFIISLPKPDYEQSASAMRTEFLISLREAVRLTDYREFDQARKLVDELSAVPAKTNTESRMLNQLRDYVRERQNDL